MAVTCTPKRVDFVPVVLRDKPVPWLFEKAAELGYDGVELHLRRPEDIDAEETCRLQERYGLSVTTLGTGMAGRLDGLTLAHPDKTIRKQTVKLVKEYIELARFLGSDVTIGSLNGCIGTDMHKRKDRRQAVVDCYQECATEATAQGVTLLCEPLNRYESDYLNTVSDGLQMIADIGIDSVKLLCDTFHMNIEEANLAASLHEADSHLGYVHFADSNRCAPGQGHIPFRQVVQALRGMNYEGIIAFECIPGNDPVTTAREALRYVKKILEV